MAVKIYGIPMSQNVRKALAVANHLNIPVESIPCIPGDDDIKAVNPSGRIPALEDDGARLYESNAICIYLASKTGNDLYPEDPATRAKIHQWMFWDVAHWTPAYQPIQFERLVKQWLGMGETDETVVDAALVKFHREAGLLNDALDGNDWLVGDGPTLADFSVGAGLTYAGPIRLPLEDYPNIRAWNDRLDALDSWRRSAPQR